MLPNCILKIRNAYDSVFFYILQDIFQHFTECIEANTLKIDLLLKKIIFIFYAVISDPYPSDTVPVSSTGLWHLTTAVRVAI